MGDIGNEMRNEKQTGVAWTGGRKECKGLFHVGVGGGCSSRQAEEHLTEHYVC